MDQYNFRSGVATTAVTSSNSELEATAPGQTEGGRLTGYYYSLLRHQAATGDAGDAAQLSAKVAPNLLENRGNFNPIRMIRDP